MELKLGLPYMGSKRKLSKRIVDKILQDNPNCKYVYEKTIFNYSSISNPFKWVFG